ncbi:pantoate--beta-alanine ligase [Pseudalkalibacillus decolorationis]|uniref:pantoate--beta-alanine ligase n=1 Tax=Pseudalkalibacillus decolorationis TaxID=163879 RepID=UPI0021490F2D|nr:pantoate--beta-alanine ligase [Pseudalkalibacillus decolorationis]
MNLFEIIKDMQLYITTRKQSELKIGFVPTMGYLHEGHAALMQRAREECDLVIISIFVNPLQFGPNEDLDQYPKDFERDVTLARIHGVDAIFVPHSEEMYPEDEPGCQLSVTGRTGVLCGKSRPGHFDGVVTVLTKLFHIIQPDRAYFGLKDAQQVAVVDDLIKTFNFPIELVGCATVREDDGLALSSRNVNLSETEREQAPLLYQSLLSAKKSLESGSSIRHIKKALISQLESIEIGHLDYVEILTYPKLKNVTSFEETIIIALAYQFENARLIDNIIISESEDHSE